MAKTGRQSIQQMLRLPDDLRDRLRACADDSGRSLNAEIVQRLEESFGAQAAPEKILYVLLDADGHPISWPEITTHVAQITEAGSFSPSAIQVHVFNSDLQNKADRSDEWADLVKHYRSLRRRQGPTANREED